jgi:hypothetical protein
MMDSEKAGAPKSAEHPWDEEIGKLREQIFQLQGQLDEYEYREVRSDARTRNRGRSGRSDAAELGRRTARMMRDTPARMMNETGKLMRGFTFTFLEQLNMWANVVNTFTEEVIGRNQPNESASGKGAFENSRFGGTRSADLSDDPDRDDSEVERGSRSRSGERFTGADLAARLPMDIYAGFLRALDESLDMPSRVVDRWYQTYHETDDVTADSEAESARPVADDAKQSSRASARKKRRTSDQQAAKGADALD